MVLCIIIIIKKKYKNKVFNILEILYDTEHIKYYIKNFKLL